MRFLIALVSSFLFWGQAWAGNITTTSEIILTNPVSSQTSAGAHLIDADGEQLAQIFQVPGSGNITNVSFRATIVPDAKDLNITLQTVDYTGNATGTLFGGSAPAYINVTAAGYYDVAFSTPAAYNASDVVAVVIGFNSTAGNITIYGYSGALGNFPYTELMTGGSWTKVSNSTAFGIKVNNTYWANTQGSVGVVAAGSANSGSSPDEIGSLLNFSYPCSIMGVYWNGYPGSTSANYTTLLYDENNTVLASVSKGGGMTRSTAGQSTIRDYFNRTVNLTPNHEYRIALRPDTSTNINFMLHNTTLQSGGFYTRTYRTDAGSWTNDTVNGLYVFPILNGFDDGTSIGNSTVSCSGTNYPIGD
jgi:hypothetical protein